MRAALGTDLGFVSSPTEPVGITLRAVSEYVPPGQRAGEFGGFRGEYTATVFARNQATVCAVAKDAEGRFHVVDTGRPAGSFPGSTGRTASMSLKPRRTPRLRVIRWMNLAARFQFGRWARLRDEARAARKRYQEGPAKSRPQLRREAERLYVELLLELYGVELSEVHVSASPSDRVPGKINFELDLGALGETEPVALPKSRGEQPAVGTIAIGPGALTAPSPFLAQATLVHEETHLAHVESAQTLRAKWNRSRTKLGFAEWLKEQKLSAVEYALVLERASGATANSEALAHLADFMYAYQRLDPRSEAARVAFLDLSTSPSPNAQGLAEYWVNADKAVQDAVIERLQAYYQRGMDEEHRAAFMEFVTRLRDATERRSKSSDYDVALLPFFERLAKFTVRPRR
jgi:hypothetical protein